MLAGQLAGYDWTGVGESLDAETVLGGRNGAGARFLRPEAKTTRSR
jgi:hypothetical protein